MVMRHFQILIHIEEQLVYKINVPQRIVARQILVVIANQENDSPSCWINEFYAYGLKLFP
ncbi:hypothetical protein CANARDRAFT_30752 [[Candida] arabinofermentans NRRL YB-2248]|uniref:Uncharacterized protein n=1 Tax=[Candida] arabinofermentans NRRL YB-2248 TaxID=983967 RepID=A0A1E4SSU7_9ASCO|nr:hypothetical protein CANARDRAFT_30752 [[Candida] arabinofermentans NRRL YB-2248]